MLLVYLLIKKLQAMAQLKKTNTNPNYLPEQSINWKFDKPRTHKQQVYQNLLDLLSTSQYKSIQLKFYNKKPVGMYMKIPFLVGVEYNLISLSEFPVFENIDFETTTRLKRIGDEFYGWAKPCWKKGELMLFIKGKLIPASRIFGDHINKTSPRLRSVS